jgi:hypothetical protein
MYFVAIELCFLSPRGDDSNTVATVPAEWFPLLVISGPNMLQFSDLQKWDRQQGDNDRRSHSTVDTYTCIADH